LIPFDVWSDFALVQRQGLTDTPMLEMINNRCSR